MKKYYINTQEEASIFCRGYTHGYKTAMETMDCETKYEPQLNEDGEPMKQCEIRDAKIEEIMELIKKL